MTHQLRHSPDGSATAEHCVADGDCLGACVQGHNVSGINFIALVPPVPAGTQIPGASHPMFLEDVQHSPERVSEKHIW